MTVDSIKTEKYFRTSQDHLLAEVKRIELKLLLEATRARQEDGKKGDGRSRGFYITQSEIDAIITSQLVPEPSCDDAPLVALAEPVRKTEASILEAKAESRRRGFVLRLERPYSLGPLFLYCHLSQQQADQTGEGLMPLPEPSSKFPAD